MAIIRATCPSCGDVELREWQVVVRVLAGESCGTYVFRCPVCTAPSVHDAEAPIVTALAEVGVRVQHWHLPAELAEPRPTGKPFTSDDQLDFHALLTDERALQVALMTLPTGHGGHQRAR